MSENLQKQGNQTFLQKIFRKKDADLLISNAKKSHLKKTLNAFDLTILGIGAIIGAGIFTLSGTAAAGSDTHVGAGPALILSFVFAGIACALAAICYAEFAAMIPVAGSAYTYTQATMGEIAAWLIGWILMLEYAIGNITVASGWSGYLMQFLKGFNHVLPNWLVNPPVWLTHDYHTAILKLKELGVANPDAHIPHIGFIPFSIDLPAILIITLITSILFVGVKESTRMASVMVAVKLAVILLFIGAGAFYVQPQNWTPFMPNGWQGVFTGAFLVFFAYIGFDAVSTAAEETKNPQRDIPIGIIASLAICTVIYIAVAAILTGIIPWNQIDTHAPVAAAMRSIHLDWAAGVISLGAIAGLTSVLLVLQLGTTRILFAMARDRLLPKVFSSVHPKFGTPHIITIAAGILVAAGTLVLDLNAAAELCNIGTLTAFLIVCLGVVILRKTDPDRPRAFKVPFSPVTPIAGIVVCLGLIILGVPHRTLVLFAGWIIIGLIIYFAYGYRNSHKADENELLTEEITVE